MLNGLWRDPTFWETMGQIFIFLLICFVGLKILNKFYPGKTLKANAAVKSWLLSAPPIVTLCGFALPIPLLFLTLISIFASKTFFRMTGMYHRSWFVWLTYLSQLALGLLVHFQLDTIYYHMAPMAVTGALFFIPILRNSFSQMLQYISLSLLTFIFFGWCLMHLGRLMYLPNGIYAVLYIYILTEFSESTLLAANRIYGKHKLFQKISQRFSVEAFFISLSLTLVLAWGLRHMLPQRSEPFWTSAGLIATVCGAFGHLAISIIRRDLNIKDSGVFIIGRDDILARADKLIFVGPIFYYTLQLLQQVFP